MSVKISVSHLPPGIYITIPPGLSTFTPDHLAFRKYCTQSVIQYLNLVFTRYCPWVLSWRNWNSKYTGDKKEMFFAIHIIIAKERIYPVVLFFFWISIFVVYSYWYQPNNATFLIRLTVSLFVWQLTKSTSGVKKRFTLIVAIYFRTFTHSIVSVIAYSVENFIKISLVSVHIN
jgi:hypothetical protein